MILKMHIEWSWTRAGSRASWPQRWLISSPSSLLLVCNSVHRKIKCTNNYQLIRERLLTSNQSSDLFGRLKMSTNTTSYLPITPKTPGIRRGRRSVLTIMSGTNRHTWWQMCRHGTCASFLVSRYVSGFPFGRLWSTLWQNNELT